jgi:catechol 2,3-dioxygenase-like lactoylglutathione lyase family enzyme
MSAQPVKMKIEVVVIPVSDVDRAKRFYTELGWRPDLDASTADEYQVVAVRTQLLAHGIEVGEPFYDAGGLFHHAEREMLTPGLQPQRNSYGTYATFRDPDGNSWVIQEIIERLTGDRDGGPLTSVSALQDSLRRAKAAAGRTP